MDKKLYFITDSSENSDEEILEKLEESLKGGVDLVQLREKSRPDLEVLNFAREIKKICDYYGVPLIIDDRLDLALILGCGLHLGARDIPIKEARKLLSPTQILGASAKSLERALEAEKEGATYLGVGAIYPTTTKVITRITSVSTLKEIKKSVKIPVYAIGGLNHQTIDILEDSGVDGVCVVSALMKAENPLETARKLRKKINEIL